MVSTSRGGIIGWGRMKILKKLFPIFIGVATLFIFWPLWQGYLMTENRQWPTWDPGSHYNDGLMLFLQLRELDVLSFLYQIIHFAFWLPTHPLLVCLSQVFSWGQMESAVFLNFILMALAGFGILEIVRRQTQGEWGVMIVGSLLYLAVMLSLQQSTPWVFDMNRVMLEPLCFGLTLIALLLWSLGEFKWGSVALFALLMTKIHYGLYLVPAFLFTSQSGTISLKLLQDTKASLKSKVGVVFLILFGLGCLLIIWRVIHGPWEGEWLGQHISFNRYHNALWFVLFVAQVFVLKIVRKNWSIIRSQSLAFALLLQYALIPFSLYYLIPGEHKVKAFIENASYVPSGQQLSFVDKYTHFFRLVASEYLGFDLVSLLLICTIVGFGLSWRSRRLKFKSFTPFLAAVTFMILMGRVALFREARFGVSLAAILVSLPLLLLIEGLRGRKTFQIAVGLLLVCFLGWKSVSWVRPLEVAQKTSSVYLATNTHEWSQALERMDFSQPTIVWGMGLDHLVPKVVTEFLVRVPHLSSYVNRPHYYINDLGYKGMRAPEDFIQQHWMDGRVKQLLLYQPGLEKSAHQYKNLLNARVVYESQYWLLLSSF